MRFTLLVASAAALLLAANSPLSATTQQASDATPVTASAPAPQDVQSQPPRGGDVDITIGQDDGTVVWYANPVWIAIGLMAIVIVGLLIGMVARGSSGGDTIVK